MISLTHQGAKELFQVRALKSLWIVVKTHLSRDTKEGFLEEVLFLIPSASSSLIWLAEPEFRLKNEVVVNPLDAPVTESAQFDPLRASERNPILIQASITSWSLLSGLVEKDTDLEESLSYKSFYFLFDFFIHKTEKYRYKKSFLPLKICDLRIIQCPTYV